MAVSITDLKQYAAAVFNQTREMGTRKLCVMIADYRPEAAEVKTKRTKVVSVEGCPACAARRKAVREAVTRFRKKQRSR